MEYYGVKEHFISLKEAKEVEARALDGDDNAMVQMMKFWQAPRRVEDPPHWHPYGFIMEKIGLIDRGFGYHQRDKATATAYKNAASEAFHPEAIPFPESVKLGNREPLAYHKVCVEGARQFHNHHPSMNIPHFRYKTDIPLGDTAEWNVPSDHRLIVQTFTEGDDYRNVIPVKLKARTEKVIPLLEECAKAGNSAAAQELANIFNTREWRAKYEVSSARSDRTYSFDMANPFMDLGKADYWNRVTKALTGEKPDQVLLDDLIFKHDNTGDGVYNIAVALYQNPKLREAFNTQQGRAADDAGSFNDYFKHAATLGNANAAWKYAQAWEKSVNKEGNQQQTISWYHMAADMGHPNAKHRLAYLTKNKDASRAVAVVDSPELRDANPSRRHMQRYPASVGKIAVQEHDFSFLTDPSQGNLLSRIRKAISLSDNQVAEFETVMQSLQAKVESILLQAAAKGGSIEDLQQQIDAGFKHNTKITHQIGEKERNKPTAEKLAKREAAKITSGLAVGILTGGHTAPHAIAHTLGRTAGSLEDFERHEDHIARLKVDVDDIPLIREKASELKADIEKLTSLASVASLQKDQAAVGRLLQGYLRRQVLESAIQNSEFMDKQAKKNGLSGVDELLAAFTKDAEQSGNVAKKRVVEALHNFCYGFADTDDLNVVMAYSDKMGAHSAATPASPHDITLHSFVERHIKPNIDDYASKSSRIDVLKAARFELLSINNPGDLKALKESNTALASLMQSEFASEGSLEVNKIFDFYLHRHGNTRLYPTRLNDGLVTDDSEPKAVKIWTEGQKTEFIERTIHSYKHNRTELPKVDSIFLRACAAEYFDPQSIATSGVKATFRENPQAPVAYPMANDVISNFIERMSLSPFGKYREVMEDRQPVDALIAQSFIDFFAALGQLHSKQFVKEREDMAKAYDLKAYGTRFRDCYHTITDDAFERYELFKDIFAMNLQKTLDISVLHDRSTLITQLEEIKQMGASGLSPENLIMPGTEDSLQRAIHGNRHFENMYPPFTHHSKTYSP